MHIKRYEGASMEEVLARVRAEFGPDALVLSTRRVRKDGGRFGRFARPVVEVTAAVERGSSIRAEQAPHPASAAHPTLSGDPAGAPAAGATPDGWRDFRMARALVTPLEAELQSLRRSVDSLLARDEPALPGRAPLSLSPLLNNANEEAQAFLRAGLDPRFAAPLGEEARALIDSGTDASSASLEALSRRLDPRLAPPRLDQPPGVLLFVGSAGAGKTTTLLKQAVRRCDEDEGGPALISTDVARPGGEALLRAHARRLCVPFETATGAAQLAETVSRHASRGVWIDTVGRNLRDTQNARELRGLRESLPASARVCLVLQATQKESDLRAEIDRYAPLTPDHLVFTKLDETDDLGNVLNLALEAETPPLSWITDGQRVPEDLHIADPIALARRSLRIHE